MSGQSPFYISPLQGVVGISTPRNLFQGSRVYSLSITHVTHQTMPSTQRRLVKKRLLQVQRLVLMIRNIVHGKKLTRSPQQCSYYPAYLFYRLYLLNPFLVRHTKNMLCLKSCPPSQTSDYPTWPHLLPHLTVVRIPQAIRSGARAENGSLKKIFR